jgi:ribosomal protein S18 acetylase RimI-like enzyme
VTLRAGEPGDEAGLIAIDHLAAGGDAGRAAELRLRVAQGECLVHVDHGTVDGYAVLRPGHFFGRDFIDVLVVAGSARRRGIGTALVRAAVERSGGDQVFTSTNRSNLAMQGLLSALGWQLSGELDGLDEGDSELVYFVWRQPPAERAAISSKTRQLPP